MTTHFTSGVTNVDKDTTLGKFKAPAPHKYHTYFNDFDTYLASDWTITTTEDGTGSATEALADGDGGLLLVPNAAGDNAHDLFHLVKEGFTFLTRLLLKLLFIGIPLTFFINCIIITELVSQSRKTSKDHS